MLEKVGKGGKSALFNLKGGHFIRFVKLNIQSIYWSAVIARENNINENTYETIFRFKSNCNISDTICDIVCTT